MSAKNTSSSTSKFFQAFNIVQIHPELHAEDERIMNHIQRRVFSDPDLNYQQQMFSLHQPAAVENEFILYLYHCIYNMNISETLRDFLLINLHKISKNSISIDMYSGTTRQPIPYNDFNEEDFAQATTATNSGEYDVTIGLENQLLQDIELQHDLPTLPSTINNTDENSISLKTPDNC